MIKQIIEQYYLESQKKERPSNVYYVTSLVSCQAIHYNGIMPALHGMLMHDAIQRLVKDSGKFHKVEVEKEIRKTLSTGHELHGRVDLVLDDEHLVEIKTASYLRVEHVYQVALYNFIHPFETSTLLYVSTKGMKEYSIFPDRVEDEEGNVVMSGLERIDEKDVLMLIKRYDEGENYHPFNQCNTCYISMTCPYSTT